MVDVGAGRPEGGGGGLGVQLVDELVEVRGTRGVDGAPAIKVDQI